MTEIRYEIYVDDVQAYGARCERSGDAILNNRRSAAWLAVTLALEGQYGLKGLKAGRRETGVGRDRDISQEHALPKRPRSGPSCGIKMGTAAIQQVMNSSGRP